MTWDLRAEGARSIGQRTLPGVMAQRGATVGRNGLVPHTGRLAAVLDRDVVETNDDLELVDEVTAVGITHRTRLWGGVVRSIDEVLAREINERRLAVQAYGSIADIVAARSGYSTRVYTNITVPTAINIVLDTIGFPANMRDIGPSSRLLGWWWMDPNWQPWNMILTLMRTAGPNARIYEDDQGRFVFRDEPVAAAAAGTLYGRLAGTGERAIVSRLENDDLGYDRIINDVTIRYAEAVQVPVDIDLMETWGSYNTSVVAPTALAEIPQGGVGARAGGNVIALVGMGAYISGSSPDPVPEEEPSIDTLLSESWNTQLVAPTAIAAKQGAASVSGVAYGTWAEFDATDVEYDELELSGQAQVIIPRPSPDAGAVLGDAPSIDSVALSAVKWRGDVLTHTPGTPARNESASVTIRTGGGTATLRQTTPLLLTETIGPFSTNTRSTGRTGMTQLTIGRSTPGTGSVTIPAAATNIQVNVTAATMRTTQLGPGSAFAAFVQRSGSINVLGAWQSWFTVTRSGDQITITPTVNTSIQSFAGWTWSAAAFSARGRAWEVTVEVSWTIPKGPDTNTWVRNVDVDQHTTELAAALTAGLTSSLAGQSAEATIAADVTPRPSGLALDTEVTTGDEGHRGEWYIAGPPGYPVPSPAGSFVRLYVTGATFLATVNYQWPQVRIGMRKWSALYVARGVAPLGRISSSARFETHDAADTIRATANMLAISASRGGEPRIVEAGAGVSANTHLIAVLVVESNINAAPVVTTPPGWTAVAGDPTLIGGGTARRVLFAATRELTAAGIVPDPAWVVTGPDNIVQRKAIVAVAGHDSFVWEDSARERTLAAGQTVTVPVVADGPIQRLIEPVAGEDFTLEAGSLTTVELVDDDDLPVGVHAAIRLTAGVGGARIAGLRLRGAPVLNDGLTVNAIDQTSIMANNGRHATLPFRVWEWLSEAEAQALADDWVEHSSRPRRSWTVVLDGDRNVATRNAAIHTRMRERVQTNLDADFRYDGEMIGVEHRITGKAGNLQTRLMMLAASTAPYVEVVGIGTAIRAEVELADATGQAVETPAAHGAGTPIAAEVALADAEGQVLRARGVGSSIAAEVALSDGEGSVATRGVGTNITAEVALSDATGRELRRADAPIVNIHDVPTALEGTTVRLGAAIQGGVYDTLAYEWSVDGGTLDDRTAERPVWTRPQVTATEDYTIRLTVTARGTGTNAVAGSTDTASDQVIATVENPVATGTPIVAEVALADATGRAVSTAPHGVGTPIAADVSLADATGAARSTPRGALTVDDIPIKVDNHFIVIADPEEETDG